MRAWRQACVVCRVALQQCRVAAHTRNTATAAAATRRGETVSREQAVEAVSNEVFAAGNLRMRSSDSLTTLPEGVQSYPEVCFIGKPNVGKSTIVSCLLHNSKLAQSGRMAGTTRKLQFYNVGDALLLVDTPGYGSWAGHPIALSRAKQANALAILFRYLALRKHANLRRVYWVMEANARGPMLLQPRDVELRDFLARERIAYTVLLTKIDRHVSHCVALQRRTLRIRRDGAPVPPPPPLQKQQRRSRHTASPPPAEVGIARNVHEIQAFLRSGDKDRNTKQSSSDDDDDGDDVPIFAVCANRVRPQRCYNLTRLQHDIVRHCCAELPRVADVTVARLRALRYAPPHADDVERVQLRFPIESFVVPDDDNMTLAAMVRQHEQMKARYVARHDPLLLQQLLLSPRDALAQRAQQEQLAATSTQQQQQQQQIAANDNETPLLPASSSRCAATASGSSSSCVLDGRRSSSNTSVTCSHDTQAAKATTTTTTLPLPFALDEDAKGVCAINGVCIPRTMVLPSVHDVAAAKADEKTQFALQYSGAGAYEALLRRDRESHDPAAADAAAPLLFTACEAAARVPESVLDRVGEPRVHSAAWRRKQRLLLKYVARRRKPRSVQLHAQGYMCPWLASAGQPHRNAVVGLPPSSAYTPGRGGARLQGRRASGFGGRSHSACTLRQHGRATNKVGFWSA